MSIKKLFPISIVISSVFVFFACTCFALSLNWEAPDSGPVDGYRVYYGQNKTSMEYHQQVDKNTLSISLNSIFMEAGNTYSFGVKAYNATGESEFSNIVSYTPEDTTAPLPPTGVTVE